MSGIAVAGLDSAGGAQLGGAAAPWSVDGGTIVVQGDPVAPHPPAPPHNLAPAMAQGSAWFTIDGVPVCRAGDLASCGHATTGRPWWTLPA